MDDDEKSDFLRHSMDPTKSMQQEVRERKTTEHRNKSLLKSAGEIWDDLSSAQKTAMGLTDSQVRKHQKGGAQKRGGGYQGNHGNNQAKRNKSGGNKWGNGGNGNAKNHQNHQNRHYNNDRHYSNDKGGNHNNKGGNYKKPYVKHESKDYRPIPKKEEKKEYNN
jgi:bisphosphoglycerate-dependent phosphoglycerate mutase